MTLQIETDARDKLRQKWRDEKRCQRAARHAPKKIRAVAKPKTQEEKRRIWREAWRRHAKKKLTIIAEPDMPPLWWRSLSMDIRARALQAANEPDPKWAARYGGNS